MYNRFGQWWVHKIFSINSSRRLSSSFSNFFCSRFVCISFNKSWKFLHSLSVSLFSCGFGSLLKVKNRINYSVAHKYTNKKRREDFFCLFKCCNKMALDWVAWRKKTISVAAFPKGVNCVYQISWKNENCVQMLRISLSYPQIGHIVDQQLKITH